MLVLVFVGVRGTSSNKSHKERNNKNLVEQHDERRQRCKIDPTEKRNVMVCNTGWLKND